MTALPLTFDLAVASGRDSALDVARRGRVALLLAVIVGLSLLDLVVTLGYMTSTGMYESNPIVRWLVATTESPLAIVGWKALTVGFSVGVLHRLRDHRLAEGAAWGLAVVLAWLTVQWFLYAHAMSGIDPVVLASLGEGLTVFPGRAG